jgi:hypothetical protein
MTSKRKQSKWTAAQIKAHIRGIEQAVEKHKSEHKGGQFTVITTEEIERKFKRVNSPMIVSQGWSAAPAPGTFNFSLNLYNPDPTPCSPLFAHVWVGSGNVDPNVGTFLQNVDPRFPRLTLPKFYGLTLAAGASTTLNYLIKVPGTVEKTNYLLNSCLMQLSWHDVGTYLDRSVYVFEVA